MHHHFWQQRWREGRLGFHQQKVNSRLRKLWTQFTQPTPAQKTAPPAPVFVPLCGKTLDMLWLSQQSHPVLGIEISEIACHHFYRENQIPYQTTETPNPPAQPFTKFLGANIQLWCGDFFALRPHHLTHTPLAYDRASLIALPREMRPAYAAHLAHLLQPNARVLLISMDYDQNKMKGPPFSVPETEIRQLFTPAFTLKIIAQSSGPDIVGNLAQRGLDTLNEKVYALTRN